jgi:nucleoside-diphosphate-sugar epimerase
MATLGAGIPDGTHVAAVAISSASGFLGTHLARGFDARGARVLPLVAKIDERSPAGARVLDGVLGDPSGLAQVDALVLAPPARPPHGVDAASHGAANIELIERTLRACAEAAVRRVVLVSSVAVYGFPARLPVSEEHVVAPRTAHAAAMVEAEMRATRVARGLGVELTIVRPSITYGPNGDDLLHKMAAMIRAGTYRIVGSGENVLHFAHVDDIVDGIWLATARREAAGEDFILAGPETATLAAISALVARAVGRDLSTRRVPGPLARALAVAVDLAVVQGIMPEMRDPFVNHEKLDALTLSSYFDVSKARRELGFAPRVGYEEGIMRALRGEWPALARAGAT